MVENKTQPGKLAKYDHAEAFCVMQYHCESCGKNENLWNSRDGVTPFVIDCIHCNGRTGMQHNSWQLDTCTPDYVPNSIQRVFVDITLTKAIEGRQEF